MDGAPLKRLSEQAESQHTPPAHRWRIQQTSRPTKPSTTTSIANYHDRIDGYMDTPQRTNTYEIARVPRATCMNDNN